MTLLLYPYFKGFTDCIIYLFFVPKEMKNKHNVALHRNRMVVIRARGQICCKFLFSITSKAGMKACKYAGTNR